MTLTYDPTKAEGSFTMLPPGEYEVFISEIDHGFSSGGNEMLTVNYTIRDDHEQEGKGTKLRYDRFVNTNTALWRFHALNKALEVEPGVGWEDFNEWQHFIKGKAVRVVVKHEKQTVGKNAGKEFPAVAGFKKSELGGSMKAKVADDPFSGKGQIDINDDDLPF